MQYEPLPTSIHHQESLISTFTEICKKDPAPFFCLSEELPRNLRDDFRFYSGATTSVLTNSGTASSTTTTL